MADDSRDMLSRPSPDALLEKARAETRGRLKIFLGAAPGVGKTYEMLMSGRAKIADGVDVVVGVVETHGRRETQALLDGFEIVPRVRVDYKGRALEEMDLDAILQRRPELVLVDELAHTNAQGSRHPKRYLDVKELLERGIDVYTTLNIQHVESLNDVVAQITRVRVRETVPDLVIDQADDVEVIDLTPADLIKRLHDGKVYFPDTAKRAIENYFSPGNLTALRELALRRTAQRVDDQLLSHMQANAISGPWAAGDRVVVCIDEHPGGTVLVRYARRLADRLRGPWTALYVETPGATRLSEADKNRIASISNGCLTRFTVFARAIRSQPAPASGCQYRAVSLKRWAARSPQNAGRIVRARFSRSGCLRRRKRRNWKNRHDKVKRQDFDR